MSATLFIRTYWKDLDWLDLCLKAMDRHCVGFAAVVVAVPQASRAWVERRVWTSDVQWVYGADYADDYLGQQITKLEADLVVDAPLIVHVDADCIFTRTTRPEDLAPGGRPWIVTRPIADLGRHYPWRGATERFVGFDVDLDFMQQPPFAYPRWLYSRLRAHCLERHRTPLRDYVAGRPPRGFSEFNALGAYAWRHHREAFNFVPAGSDLAPPAHCDWHWSWGGITDEVRRRIDDALAPPTAIET